MDMLTLRAGSYLASDQTVDLTCQCLGISKCCATGSCTGVALNGHGKVFFNGFGSVLRVTILPGEMRKFNNGFVVAWSSNPELELSPGCAGNSCLGSICIGEGIALKITNQSKVPQVVYVQTRSLRRFAKWLQPYIWPSGSGGTEKGGKDDQDRDNK